MNTGYFNVLRPVYFGTGQFFTSIDNKSGRVVEREYQRIEWQKRGTALDMADAKEQFGGAPVLEWVAA